MIRAFIYGFKQGIHDNILFLKNFAIALARMPKAVLGLYKYHPDDGYVKNVLVTLDCLGNTLLAGDPDETISSRSGKSEAYELAHGTWGVGCRLCSFLAVFQKDHCQKAVERWRGRRAVIPDAPTE